MIGGGLKELMRRREEYGVSKKRLAEEAHLSPRYLRRLEAGEIGLTERMERQISDALDRLSPGEKLSLVIDYVRIRFKTTDFHHIIRNVLRIDESWMYQEKNSWYGYESRYSLGNVFVLTSLDSEKGTLLELKGQGCREFEGFLEAQGRDWYQFFNLSMQEGCVFKRLDLAINDIFGILDIRELTQKCKDDECISKFRSWRSYRSGELIQRDEKDGMGYTLYIGSLKSDVYFCIYEKDYEQYIKKGIEIEEVPVKNRFEIRLMNERAEHAVVDLVTFRDGDDTAFSIINRYMRFADKEPDKERESWKTNERWSWFIGDHRNKLKLTSQPEPYSPLRTLRWLAHQVAPSWKAFQEVDQNNGTEVMKEMLEGTQLTDRLKKLVEQLSVTIEDMIV